MCKAYRETPSQDVHLLARLVSEIRTAIKDVAFGLTLLMLTSFVRSQNWRKLIPLSVNSGKLRLLTSVNPSWKLRTELQWKRSKNPWNLWTDVIKLAFRGRKLTLVTKQLWNGIPRRLQNIEQRLFKKPDIARAYSDCIEQYISKGYIRKVPVTEEQTSTKWFLPHFPIVKSDRTTTKTRIVFYIIDTEISLRKNDT